MTFRNFIYGASAWPSDVFTSSSSSSAVVTAPRPATSSSSSLAADAQARSGSRNSRASTTSSTSSSAGANGSVHPLVTTAAGKPIPLAFPTLGADVNARYAAVLAGRNDKHTSVLDSAPIHALGYSNPSSSSSTSTALVAHGSTGSHVASTRRSTWRSELVTYFAGFSLDDEMLKKLERPAGISSSLQSFLSVCMCIGSV